MHGRIARVAHQMCHCPESLRPVGRERRACAGDARSAATYSRRVRRSIDSMGADQKGIIHDMEACEYLQEEALACV